MTVLTLSQGKFDKNSKNAGNSRRAKKTNKVGDVVENRLIRMKPGHNRSIGCGKYEDLSIPD